jgi:hypothetical protein
MGVSADEATSLADALGLIPADVPVHVDVTAPSTSDAEGIGRDIAAGVARGMDLGKDEVDQAAQRLVGSAHAAARAAAGISSPSRLFAEEVGGPISEGVAQGILDALNAPQSAIDTLFEELMSRSNEGANNVISGVGAVFGTQDAQARLDKAEAELERIKSSFDRDPAKVAAAEREVARAQLALVSASESMVEAGQQLIGQGPEGEARFRTLAQMAGLSDAEINGLVTQLQTAQAWAGQFLPGDVSGLIGSGDPSAAVGANIIINMPPGTDPDQVVAAIEEWVRKNGPLSFV